MRADMNKRLQYWRRIIGAYVLHKKDSNLSFWHTDLEANRLLEEDLCAVRHYPMNFKAKTRYKAFVDQKGVIMLDYKGALGLRYNPNAIAQSALGFYELYLDALGAGDFSSLDRHKNDFLTQAEWFLDHGRPVSDDIRLWEYEFDFEGRELQKAPWRSALAQGQALSVLIRAFQLTGNPSYSEAAHKGFNAFRRDGYEHPHGVICKDDEGVWLEEVFFSKPNHILNGLIWALWGVRDYMIWTGDPYAVRLYNQSEQTLADHLHLYDLGFWTAYDDPRGLKGPLMPTSPYYHRLHTVQMECMYMLTKRDVYGRTHEKWAEYGSKSIYLWSAFAWKCWFKMRYW